MRHSSELEFETLQKEKLYHGFFQLNRYTFRNELFAGGWSDSFQREIFERGHAAAALLLDPDKEVLVLVEQFRPGAVETEESPWLIEPVAGIIEAGESPADVVTRESVEEAGCQVKRLHKICEYLVSPGGTTERIWLFLAEVDSDGISDLGGLDHENEDIRIHKMPVNLVFEMLENGQLNNAMTLIAVQWLKLNWSDRANFWL